MTGLDLCEPEPSKGCLGPINAARDGAGNANGTGVLNDDYRYWGFYAHTQGAAVQLDQTNRAHAHVEQPDVARLHRTSRRRRPVPAWQLQPA